MQTKAMRGVGIVASLAAAVVASRGLAQDAPVHQVRVGVGLDSGLVESRGPARGVVYSSVVDVPERPWIRLTFDHAHLGAAPAGGRPTILRITSLLDGAVQTMSATHLEQWQDTSAYFNGPAVRLEIVADPGAAPSRVVVGSVLTAEPTGDGGGAITSICGATDDRVLSDDVRVARKFPSGCTVWLIDDANHCFLTAGHCTGALNVVEFNVPLSGSDGSARHPGPEDQYTVDPVSMQSNGGQGVGNDWAYFGCFPNSTTGLTAYETQGAYFVLADAAPPVDDQLITITGFGSTSSPVPPQWNRAQKTHDGPYHEMTGTTVRYRTDTTGGNSGSPVIDASTGMAIGIHTHGGCSGGANNGTAIHHSALQNALANPRGVCIPVCHADLDGSGDVGFDDLVQMLFTWGPCGACPEDLDGDGVAGIADLLLLLAAWGPCP
jgi:V8-like Glu-specific endopeptidase